MLRHLRNKIILINLLTTTIILVAAYSTIYLIVKNSAENRPLDFRETVLEFSDASPNPSEFRTVIEDQIFADRRTSLGRLLFTLITTGVAIEVLVFIFSCLYAEEAIKPVRAAYEAQKTFIANASHEIKTPIAAIKANLEAADLYENHWIKNIETEANKIEALNLSLLRLAKSDAIKTTPSLETETDLKGLLTDITDSFRSRLDKKHIVLKTTFDLKEKSAIKVNSSDLREIIEILFDNAIKYCDQKISLTISTKSFKIENDGKIIPKESLPHIFDRFYQVDKSTSGSGLGLAIASSLAEKNHWTLKADSTEKTTSFILNY